MQNRYVGDLGDFGKYGLLRALCGRETADGLPELSLAVIWYLVADEQDAADGRHINYLDPDLDEPTPANRTTYRECDIPLYDALRCIVRRGERNVTQIQASPILGPAAYYDEPLTYDGLTGFGNSGREKRLDRRTQWVGGALDLVKDRDVVFVDPDNGLEVASVAAHQKTAPKYVFRNELEKYWANGTRSLVIYHHLCRDGTASAQIQKRAGQLADRFGADPLALYYGRGTARVFFVVPSERHRDVLTRRAETLASGPWAKHFVLWQYGNDNLIPCRR